MLTSYVILQTALNVIVGFVVVYTTPYLLSTPGANLGAKLGYVWAGFAGLGAIWAWFCMPELKGRSLEDMDELFAAKLPAWRFKDYDSTDQACLTAREKDLKEDTGVQIEHLEA